MRNMEDARMNRASQQRVTKMEDAKLFVGRTVSDESLTRLILAAYLLGQMLDTPANSTPEKSAKERKVSAAFEYADLLLERL